MERANGRGGEFHPLGTDRRLIVTYFENNGHRKECQVSGTPNCRRVPQWWGGGCECECLYEREERWISGSVRLCACSGLLASLSRPESGAGPPLQRNPKGSNLWHGCQPGCWALTHSSVGSSGPSHFHWAPPLPSMPCVLFPTATHSTCVNQHINSRQKFREDQDPVRELRFSHSNPLSSELSYHLEHSLHVHRQETHCSSCQMNCFFQPHTYQHVSGLYVKDHKQKL